jgi:hypothetical protein
MRGVHVTGSTQNNPVSLPADADAVRALLLKESPELDLPVDTIDRKEIRREFSRIRCPLCRWNPTADSRWTCIAFGTPEPPFDSCGTVWNTFSTRGRCPGCRHQWTWTTCLRCGMPSKHDDWYENHPDA